MKTAIEKSAAGEEIDGKKWHLHTPLIPRGGCPTAPEQFKAWGADKIYNAGLSGATRLYFVRAGGKWYAALATGAISCTIQTHRAFDGPSGHIVALEYVRACRMDAMEAAKNQVWNLEREIAVIENQIDNERA